MDAFPLSGEKFQRDNETDYHSHTQDAEHFRQQFYQANCLFMPESSAFSNSAHQSKMSASKCCLRHQNLAVFPKGFRLSNNGPVFEVDVLAARTTTPETENSSNRCTVHQTGKDRRKHTRRNGALFCCFSVVCSNAGLQKARKNTCVSLFSVLSLNKRLIVIRANVFLCCPHNKFLQVDRDIPPHRTDLCGQLK